LSSGLEANQRRATIAIEKGALASAHLMAESHTAQFTFTLPPDFPGGGVGTSGFAISK
jgi:hypothetical protein